MLLTVAGKLVLEQRGSMPVYPPEVGRSITGYVAAALLAFVMPHGQPQLYWLWHSLWHCLMTKAFYELYSHMPTAAATSAKPMARHVQSHWSLVGPRQWVHLQHWMVLGPNQ